MAGATISSGSTMSTPAELVDERLGFMDLSTRPSSSANGWLCRTEDGSPRSYNPISVPAAVLARNATKISFLFRSMKVTTLSGRCGSAPCHFPADLANERQLRVLTVAIGVDNPRDRCFALGDRQIG